MWNWCWVLTDKFGWGVSVDVCVHVCMCTCSQEAEKVRGELEEGIGAWRALKEFIFVTDVAHNLGFSSTQAWPWWPSLPCLKCKISSFPGPWRVWLALTTYIFYWCFVQSGPVTISVNKDINRLPQSCWVLWKQTPSCNFIGRPGHVYQQTDLAGMESLSHLLPASKTHTHLQTLLKYGKGTESTKQKGSWGPASVRSSLTDYLFL